MRRGARLIKEARRRAGISQTALATRLGTKQPVIARWESGARTPSIDSVVRAARSCGFDLVSSLEAIDPHEEAILDQWLAMTPAERLQRNRQMLLTEKWARRARRVPDAPG